MVDNYSIVAKIVNDFIFGLTEEKREGVYSEGKISILSTNHFMWDTRFKRPVIAYMPHDLDENAKVIIAKEVFSHGWKAKGLGAIAECQQGFQLVHQTISSFVDGATIVQKGNTLDIRSPLYNNVMDLSKGFNDVHFILSKRSLHDVVMKRYPYWPIYEE